MKAIITLSLCLLGSMGSLGSPLSFASMDRVECEGTYCPELDWCFSTTSPFDKLGGPDCNPDSPEKVWLDVTLHLDDNNGAYPEVECKISPVKNLDDTSKACIQKLNARSDLTKIVIMVNGWQESLNEEVVWISKKHTALNDVDPSAAIMRVIWGPHEADPADQDEYEKRMNQDFADSRYTGKAIGLMVENIRSTLDRTLFTHCIGYSLGAQVCGFAGQHFVETNQPMLDRISGVDPGAPFFYADNLGSYSFEDMPANINLAQLDKSDAKFVDIYHTDDIIFTSDTKRGTILPTATVDFYVGRGPTAYGGFQPGYNPKEWVWGVNGWNHHFVTIFYFSTVLNKGCKANNVCEGGNVKELIQTPYGFTIPDPMDFTTFFKCKAISTDVTAGYWASTDTKPGIYTVAADKNGCL